MFINVNGKTEEEESRMRKLSREVEEEDMVPKA